MDRFDKYLDRAIGIVFIVVALATACAICVSTYVFVKNSAPIEECELYQPSNEQPAKQAV